MTVTLDKIFKIAAAICFLLATFPIIHLDVALVPLGLLLWVVGEIVEE